jgi:hypothetical protein
MLIPDTLRGPQITDKKNVYRRTFTEDRPLLSVAFLAVSGCVFPEVIQKSPPQRDVTGWTHPELRTGFYF